jgi:hypothetical protein
VGVNIETAKRGDEPFNGKANCNSCHHGPLCTEPGWNDHSPAEMKIDSFQADRSPDGNYQTMNLAALFIRERGLFMHAENKGRFYHDGRFKTLLDVVDSGTVPQKQMADLLDETNQLIAIFTSIDKNAKS